MPVRVLLLVAVLVLAACGSSSSPATSPTPVVTTTTSTLVTSATIEMTAGDYVTGRGQETLVGQPVLDIDKLMRYRTVITTYETAVSYQHSLAQMRDGKPLWSVLVTDEAQRYKAPNTKVSHAVKAIASASAFRIASTGTPVENRLLDLWTIVDSSVQTALLGDRKTFSDEFERPTAGPDLDDALGRLRRRLLYDQSHAYLLRRSKSEVLDLPAKVELTLDAEMSTDEAATRRPPALSSGSI